MIKDRTLHFLNLSVFFQTQLYLLPVLFLFYQQCGLTVSDFFLFQGIFSLFGLLFEIPMGYLGDIFPKKNILILSYFFFIIRLLLWLFFSQYGYWIILIGEVLYAAQKTSFSGIADSYLYEYTKHRKISKKMLDKYGKMNFFMSVGAAISSLCGAFLYSSISKWSLARYQHDYGFIVLLSLELILNTTAFILLFFLPKIHKNTKTSVSSKQYFSNILNIVGQTIKNDKIRWHILYSGLLAAISVVFVWIFQPMMKILLIPVSVYGVIYFINHSFRGISSLLTDKIKQIISLSKLSVLIFVLFFISFVLSFIILNVQPLPIYLNIGYFVFICFAIAIQLSFFLSHISRIHSIVSSDVRATVSSINMAVGRLYAGIFLILLNILTENSLQNSLFVCMILFLVASIPLKFVYIISKQEDEKK